MKRDHLYPRYIRSRMKEALSDSPVVLIHGPRQSGKTTLARLVGDEEGYTYFTFDDDVQREAAQTDPVGYIAELPERVILDEVQRVPELFTSLKTSVDAKRKPGRFILTGSSNVLLVPKLSDSLAGRMEILRLHPVSQVELTGKEWSFLTTLFDSDFKSIKNSKRLGGKLADKIVAGGFPAALTRSTAQRRAAWYRNYAETMIQRDVRDLSRISALDALPRLLAATASQTACLLNVSGLSAPLQISRTTVREYLTLLNRIFLLEELPPWYSNRLKRLSKTPKLHIGDTGLACALLGIDTDMLRKDRALLGHVLETFVYQELRRQASWQQHPVHFYHFRDREKTEIDIILEYSGRLAGVEVKASSTVRSDDFKGLRKFMEATESRFAAGVVLYDGEAVVPFGRHLYAVPISSLWKNS